MLHRHPDANKVGPGLRIDNLPDGLPRKLLDSSRITALGWRPAVPLAEGLRRAYEAAPWRLG